MKLPSVAFLLEEGVRSFRKFPFTILSATVAVGIALYLVEVEADLDSLTLVNLLLCGYLGVPLFVSAKIFGQANGGSQRRPWIYRALALGVLVAVYFSLPASQETLNVSISYIRYVVFAVAGHLLVSFAAFLGKGSVDDFWTFNQSLFLRFLLSALYSIVLFVGLVLALFALDSLFDLSIDGKRYFQIFILIAGIFNTWFFAAGIPEAQQGKDTPLYTATGLKTMLLYVLLPLITLYFLILYSYSAKVVFLWDWPKGIMTYMIIAMAIVGILTVLLAYPFAREKSPLSFFTKWYYVILLPLLIMLFLAIGIRIVDYGITINRYLTVLLAVWLLLVSLYFVFRGNNIKAVPMTLFAIILLTCFGPWGIFRVSEMSQLNRLEMILTEAQILNGKVVNEPQWIASDTAKFVLENDKLNEDRLTDSLHNEVKSILDYLEDYHGFKEIDGWYHQNPREIAQAHKVGEASAYMKMLGLTYRHIYKNSNRSQYAYFSAASDENGFHRVMGYDYGTKVYNNRGSDQPAITLESETIPSLQVICDPSMIEVLVGDSSSVRIDLNKHYLELRAQYDRSGHQLPDHQMTVTFEEEWIKGKLLLYTMSGNDSLEQYRGYFLLKLK